MPLEPVRDRTFDDPQRPAGVFAAVLTPMQADGAPDLGMLGLHCRWLLANGCDGLSVLGTTGEANSLTVDERLAILDHLLGTGIPGGVLLPGTGCCAIPDTVRLTARAVQAGAAGVLMLPPFYYKNSSEDGVFAAFAEVIERVGSDRLRIYLYHFPQMSGVPIGPALIERLLARYPGTIAGLKDSSGNLAGMVETARRFPGFDVFTGSDEFLLPLLRETGAGCITGLANIAAFLAQRAYRAWLSNDQVFADEAQAQLTAVRSVVVPFPLTGALKAILAHTASRPSWRHIRPPLMALPEDTAATLVQSLERIGFAVAPLP